MTRHFPEGMRPATVEERQSFYRDNFPREEVERLQEHWDRPVIVIDVGSDSTRYRPRFKQYKGKLVRITDYESLDALKQKIVEYAPEDVYYGTIVEQDGVVEVNPAQELVFDLDPEGVDCRACARRRKYVDTRWHQWMFCPSCFTEIAAATRDLYGMLEKHFEDLRVVYSGRGFHVHVGDDAAFRMEREDRRELVSKVAEGFPVDAQATTEKEIIRLPGSLHGLVSRVVTPVSPADLTTPDLILEKRTVPPFLITP